MKKYNKIILSILIIVLGATAFAVYQFYRKPIDVREESSNFRLTAPDLIAQYLLNEDSANIRYLDKVIDVKGKVMEIKLDSSGQATVFLDSNNPNASVTCSFYNDEALAVSKIKKGQKVTIKGICTGMLMDVILNKCSLIKEF